MFAIDKLGQLWYNIIINFVKAIPENVLNVSIAGGDKGAKNS